MGDPDARSEVAKHLREALQTEDADSKDFHVRQALQLLDVEDA